jgi:hypothetical protein
MHCDGRSELSAFPFCATMNCFELSELDANEKAARQLGDLFFKGE